MARLVTRANGLVDSVLAQDSEEAEFLREVFRD